jgi:hypothetical protein
MALERQKTSGEVPFGLSERGVIGLNFEGEDKSEGGRSSGFARMAQGRYSEYLKVAEGRRGVAQPIRRYEFCSYAERWSNFMKGGSALGDKF